MKRMILLVMCVLGAALQSGEQTFDPTIDAWAFGTVWGINKDSGILTLQGQLSSDAIEYSKGVALALRNPADHNTAKFEALQAKMDALEKREITANYNVGAPLTVLQCPVKIPRETPGQPPKVILTDLKIGDRVLIGYDAEPNQNRLLAIVLVENAKPEGAPAGSPGK